MPLSCKIQTNNTQFQGVPRRLLDRILPFDGSSNKIREATTVKKHALTMPRAKAASVGLASSGPKNQAAKIAPKATSKTAPGDLTARVMEIISKEAGVDSGELGPNEEFTNHGVDSLLSLTIVGRIQEELGFEVPSSLFMDYPTPKDLIRFFGARDDSSISRPSSEISSGIVTPENGGYTAVTSDQQLEPSVIDVIRDTVARETVAMVELTPTASFSDIGIDSLLALTIAGTLSETLEMEIPSTLFMENVNLEEVSKALNLEKAVKNRAAQPALGLHNAIDLDPNSDPQSTSILLWGNPKRAKKTLFLFPDGSGSATSYASLPKIGLDTAAYALNCPWMKRPHEMTCTLEVLTSKYLIEIRRRQPSGPYYLGGWSAGGICAYEAAQQLAQAGQKTERLILIDSPNPTGLENPPQRMYDFFQSLGIFGAPGKEPPSWLRPHFDAFIRLLDKYEIQPFRAEGGICTHILYACDGICKHPDDPRPEIRPDDPREMLWLLNNRTDFSGDGWASLVRRQNLHVDTLQEVNHFSMMEQGSHMPVFGDFLSRSMV